MNLIYKSNTLTSSDNTVRSADSIIKLTTDIEATYLGIILLSDESKKVIQFVNNGGEYIGRLVISEDELKYLAGSRIYLNVSDTNFIKTTNLIKLSFDVSSIKTDIKVKVSDEYKKLLERINQLENKINYPASKFLDNINIINKDVIQAGMIPVAVDGKTFVAMFPFSNHITKVNGQSAADGAVIIDSSMIKYKTGKSVEETLQDLIDAVVAVNAVAKTISDEQKNLRTLINDLDIRLTRHINDGII